MIARSGGDPQAHKKRLNMTFRDAAEAFDTEKAADSLNEKNRKQWRAALERYAMPKLGDLNVRDIETTDIEGVLRPIWASRTETAARLRARIEAILGFAAARGARTGDNPARWKANLDATLAAPGTVAKKKHHPALAPGDVAAWWSALAGREGMAARALEFVTLTAARSGEVRGMAWAEVDLEAGLWIVPADRMKASREHRVPLTAPALAILKALPRMEGSPYVFPASRGGMLSDMTISAVMRRMQEAEVKAGRAGFLDPQTKRPAVPHGLRSTFRQWTAEKGYPRDMAEIALAHQVGSDVERAYQRSDMLDRRRRMMDDWAAFLRSEVGAEVVSLRA
jgi:integrase